MECKLCLRTGKAYTPDYRDARQAPGVSDTAFPRRSVGTIKAFLRGENSN
jgi:hypothetical protein